MNHHPDDCLTCRARAAARKASRVADIIDSLAVLLGLAVIVGFCLLFGGQ
jgi:hypothetical protein